MLDKHGEVIANDSPEFFHKWQARAQRLSSACTTSGGRMYWVSPPPLADQLLGHAQRLFDGYRKIAMAACL